jgi:hypothetical protein
LTKVATPQDTNVKQKETENKLKYKNLSTEIQQMWNTKCFLIPVSMMAAEIVSTGAAHQKCEVYGNSSIQERLA